MSWIETGFDPNTDWYNGEMVDSITMQTKVSQRFLDLADRVADTGWAQASLSSNWIHAAGDPVTYRQIGSWMVWIQGSMERQNIQLSADGTWAANNVFTLPPTMTPKSSSSPSTPIPSFASVQSSFTQSSFPWTQVRVNSDGSVQIRNCGTGPLSVGDFVNINGGFLLE